MGAERHDATRLEPSLTLWTYVPPKGFDSCDNWEEEEFFNKCRLEGLSRLSSLVCICAFWCLCEMQHNGVAVIAYAQKKQASRHSVLQTQSAYFMRPSRTETEKLYTVLAHP